MRLLFLLAVVLLSRAVLLAIGIAPDPSQLEGNWQTLALADLAANLTGEIWNQHSQPPLWNTVVGLTAKVCNAEINCVVWILFGANILATWVSACLIVELLRALNLSTRIAVVMAVFFILSPSTVYYEFYIFYAHLSAVLMLGLVFALHRYGSADSRYALSFALVLAVSLCWLWSLFHPIFIGVVFVAAWILNTEKTKTRRAMAMFALAFVVAIAPSVKNQAKFGMFSNGSWVGLNMGRVVSDALPGFEPTCDFIDYRDKKRTAGVTHPGTAFNSPDMVPLSKYCVGASVTAALQNPLPIIANRLDALAHRFSLMPHDYFIPPLNWDRIPDLPFGRNGSFNNTKTSWDVKVFEWVTLGMYVFAWLAMAQIAFAHADAGTRKLFKSLLLIALFFTALSIAFNRGEQQRMRYTIEPFFLFAVVVAISQILVRVRRRA